MARSKEIVPGIGRLSRSQVKAKRGLFKGVKKSSKPAASEQPATIQKEIGGAKNGGTRLIPTKKASRFYPAEDVRAPKKSRKVSKSTKLRPTITPGTVLILLAGRFAGKRVVFLKQLESGLLLVTGPFKVNGVPLRRVNQAYVIATSTKIDLGDFKVSLPHACYFTVNIQPPFFRLTRRSTMPISRRQSPRAASPLKRSSSLTVSRRRRKRCQRTNFRLRKRWTLRSSQASKRSTFCPNTFARPSASQMVYSRIS